MFILDDLKNPGLTTQGNRWQFFTDGVMGGMSSGKVKIKKVEGITCYHMTGNVTTENNGGFIQMRVRIKPPIQFPIQSNDYEGIYLKTYGNNYKYAVHIRTPYTKLPWQYYSLKFVANRNWKIIKLPFDDFKKSNFYQTKSLSYNNIVTLGIVAGFDNFQSDICISEIGFY